jgi:hypothetical protein
MLVEIVSSLYDEVASIIDLHRDNMEHSIQGSRTPWLVKFYLSWCGGCIEYQPTYRGICLVGGSVDCFHRNGTCTRVMNAEYCLKPHRYRQQPVFGW